jgi:hypothetical protein
MVGSSEMPPLALAKQVLSVIAKSLFGTRPSSSSPFPAREDPPAAVHSRSVAQCHAVFDPPAVRERERDAVATVRARPNALHEDLVAGVHLDPVVAALEAA